MMFAKLNFSLFQIIIAAVLQWDVHGAAANLAAGLHAHQNDAAARTGATPLKLHRKLLTRKDYAEKEFIEERIRAAIGDDDMDTVDSVEEDTDMDDLTKAPAPAPSPEMQIEAGVMGVSSYDDTDTTAEESEEDAEDTQEPTENQPEETETSPTPSATETSPTPSATEDNTPTTTASGGMDRSGELTYYGGAGEGGACTSKREIAGFVTVAMNNDDYGNGAMCGTCVHACWTNEETGEGERCVDAIVDNKCPECAKGDLDLGESGSGRWPVQWKVIPCPESELIVRAQGSNAHYAKLKVEGGPSAVSTMKCGGQSGSMTDDAYFIFNDGSGKMGSGMDCDVTFSDGKSTSVHVEGSLLGGGR